MTIKFKIQNLHYDNKDIYRVSQKKWDLKIMYIALRVSSYAALQIELEAAAHLEADGPRGESKDCQTETD